jgi:5-methylcytosine-specific restriction endonuclease McrA
MPIRPEMRRKYPKEWKRISLEVRQYRAGWQCEMVTGFVRCEARQGQPHPITGSKVMLALCHLNHDPSDNRPNNLLVGCQKCHNQYDAKMRARGVAERRRLKQ